MKVLMLADVVTATLKTGNCLKSLFVLLYGFVNTINARHNLTISLNFLPIQCTLMLICFHNDPHRTIVRALSLNRFRFRFSFL